MLSVSKGSEQLMGTVSMAEQAGKALQPRKLYSEVLKQERRYEQNEASTGNEKGIVGEPTIGWDYKLVKGKWDVPNDAKRYRKYVAIRSWNKRSLSKALNGKATETLDVDDGVREAIKSLSALQLTELEKVYGKVRDKKPLTAIGDMPEKKKQSSEDRTLKEMVTLRQLWNEFVLATRIENGYYGKLPKKGCSCGRARISYPHWPPTSEAESAEQFNYCMDDNNGHRRNLVLRWWEHFNKFANMEKWEVSEQQKYYKDAADLIRLNSLVVQRELERSLTHRKRPKSWSCENYCDKVVTEKQVSCLCHCGEHRDSCPIHSY
jgi:hypothetical protein